MKYKIQTTPRLGAGFVLAVASDCLFSLLRRQRQQQLCQRETTSSE